MGNWGNRLVSVFAAAILLLGAGTVANAVSDEQAVLIPGAMPLKQINPFYPLVKHFLYPDIGINFRDDEDGQLIDYSQDPFATDRALREGVEHAIAAVREIDGRVVVLGESMGSMVAARVATQLANSSDPPAVDDIRFVLIAPPEAGVAEYFAEGTYIPILNYRVTRVPESPYLTTIAIGEYDGWADPPDRPWNLVSLFNAVLGALFFVHGQTAFADPADVPRENITVEQNSQGGTVTTYLVPTANLPLTQVFRLVGVPDRLVDRVDDVLRPIVDAGYRRHDQPGDPRPYLSEGQIRRDVPWQPEVADRRIERVKQRELRDAIRAESRHAEAEVKERVVQLEPKKAKQHELQSAIGAERRQRIGADAAGRVVRGAQRLERTRADRRVERPDR